MTILKGARRALFLLAVSGALALPAAAQEVLSGRPDSIQEALEDAGYDVEVTEASDGEGPILSSFSDGVEANFDVRFKACDDDGTECEIVVLVAGFTFDGKGEPATLERINEWNSGKWGKAWVDDEDIMWISIEVNAVGGIADDNLADTFTWWETLMADYVEFIGWEPS